MVFILPFWCDEEEEAVVESGCDDDNDEAPGIADLRAVYNE